MSNRVPYGYIQMPNGDLRPAPEAHEVRMTIRRMAKDGASLQSIRAHVQQNGVALTGSGTWTDDLIKEIVDSNLD
jgi:hypothetical protein